jgi:hypothetical protein
MKTYRISVWTGPGAAREVASRVNNLSGLLESPAASGTEHVHFNIRAEDQTDAYGRVRELLTYQGLASYSAPIAARNGVQAIAAN